MVERLLRIAFARGASSLFLTSESRPCIRVEGDIRLLDSEAVLSKADVESAIMEIVPQEAQESIGSGQATEWIAQLPGLGAHSLHELRGPSWSGRGLHDDCDPRGHGRAARPAARDPGAGDRGRGSRARDRLARQRQVHADVGAGRPGEPPARRLRDHARAPDSPRARQPHRAREPARDPRRRRRSARGGARGAARESRRAGRRRLELDADGAAAARSGGRRAARVRVDYGAVNGRCDRATARPRAAGHADVGAGRDGRDLPRRGVAGAVEEDRRRPRGGPRDHARHRGGDPPDRRRAAWHNCRSRSKAAGATAWCR